MTIAVVGAGFSGAVIARTLADAGYTVVVFDERAHVAGNCHTKRDEETGIMEHVYGPHIFHTELSHVWEFVNNHGEFRPYRHQVKTTRDNKVFSMPINLHTINQLFDKAMAPNDAKQFVATLCDESIERPNSFEEQALKLMGRELYEAFFKGYTEKQWGVSASQLPASILARLPMRFDYDDNYFNHPYQGIPVEGYTAIVTSILTHDSITVRLNTKVDRQLCEEYDHVFCSSGLDMWFDYEYGELGYRTLRFEREVYDEDFQGCPVMNYADESVPFTRISEHKHFMAWEEHAKTIIFREFSSECQKGDIPYYPIRLVKEKEVLSKYIERAKMEKKTSFVGRLGTYRYIDMDKSIAEALKAAEEFIGHVENKRAVPSFFVDPM